MGNETNKESLPEIIFSNLYIAGKTPEIDKFN